jgi:hypothetical protein
MFFKNHNVDNQLEPSVQILMNFVDDWYSSTVAEINVNMAS